MEAIAYTILIVRLLLRIFEPVICHYALKKWTVKKPGMGEVGGGNLGKAA
jgi:hypothetical protein